MTRTAARPAVLLRQAPGKPDPDPESRTMTATRNRAAITPAINGNLISSDRTAHPGP